MQITAAVSRDGESAPRLETLELEKPRAGEVLVRIVATGICHTDLHFHDGAMFGPKPIVLGHEGAGVVEEIGVGVRGLEVGDHVVMSGNSCGQCRSCQAGRPVYCFDMIRRCWSGARPDGSSPLSHRHEPVGGLFFGQSSFATHAITTERSAVKVPRDVPLHVLGPLSCGMVTGAGAILEAFRLRPGHSIVVFGAGGVGLAAVMAARIAGASQIIVVDVNERRLELARELGASEVLVSGADMADTLSALHPVGFDFTFNTTQVPAVFDAAVACLATEGTAGFVVQPDGEWMANMAQLLTGGRKLQGIIGGNANPQIFIPLLIDFWRQGRFPFDRLVTEFDFHQIDEAWEQFRDGKVIKPVLRMSQA